VKGYASNQRLNRKFKAPASLTSMIQLRKKIWAKKKFNCKNKKISKKNLQLPMQKKKSQEILWVGLLANN